MMQHDPHSALRVLFVPECLINRGDVSVFVGEMGEPHPHARVPMNVMRGLNELRLAPALDAKPTILRVAIVMPDKVG